MFTLVTILAGAFLFLLALGFALVPEFRPALDRLGRLTAFILLVPFVIGKAFFVDFDPTDYNHNAY